MKNMNGYNEVCPDDSGGDSLESLKAGYEFRRSSGYLGLSKSVTFAFNVTLALFFLVAGLPVFVTIALIIAMRNEGPVFYTGERFGLNKKMFVMYKFRTLPVGTQQKIGAELFNPRHQKLPFFCKFLRDTRLDELPQLFNILKGEMDFIGPRPLRPEVYRKHCSSIAGYDLRFEVRPGLIGYSQLFTPHSSPKRIRALIDNRSVGMKRSLGWDLYIIMLTIIFVLKKFLAMMGEFIWGNVFRSKVMRAYREKRFFDRVRVNKAFLSLDSMFSGQAWTGKLVNINETHFRVVSGSPVPIDSFQGTLRTDIRRGGKLRRKIAKCEVQKYLQLQSGNEEKKFIYVFAYTPVSDFNRYIIDQYYLKKSIVLF